MGIPYYFSYFIKSHRECIRRMHDSVDNLYLDSNSIIYDVLHEMTNTSNFEDQLISNVISKIWGYIDAVSPKKTVYIAFDGVAPVAKLEQQRNRRYKSIIQDRILKNELCTPEYLNTPRGIGMLTHEVAYKKEKGWTTSAITPGTQFMQRLEKACYAEFKSTSSLEIIVSASDEHGEGEHKIFDYIRSKPHQDAITFIYGIDSDLIMLALMHCKQCNRKIYLYRETPYFIKSIDITLEPNQEYVIDIGLLSQNIASQMRYRPTMEQEYRLVNDYVFLCMLVGNDFIPKHPALRIRNKAITTMISLYSNYIDIDTYITIGGTIVWEKFRRYMEVLSEYEHSLMIEITQNRDRESHNIRKKLLKYTMEEYLNAIPLIHRKSERWINPYQPGWKNRYYNKMFGSSAPSYVRNICEAYLQSLEWTMSYYSGVCKDLRWSFPYFISPLFSDVLTLIPMSTHEFVPTRNHPPLHPLTLLAYVTPKVCQYNLLPKSIASSISSLSCFNEYCDFKWTYCKYFWESYAIMTPIDLDNIEKIVKKYLTRHSYKLIS